MKNDVQTGDELVTDVSMRAFEPEFYTRWEGSEWLPWKGTENASTAHSIMFKNGKVFDMFNGWRPGSYTTRLDELRRKHKHR